MNQQRFERMARESTTSEELVRHWFHVQYGVSFYIVDEEEQKAGIEHGWHVPDLKCPDKPRLTIEVKEDIAAGKTGNLCFEIACIKRYKEWCIYHHKPDALLAIVNHHDFRVDVWTCGFDVDRLQKELEYLCAVRPDCNIKHGGDQGHPMYIIPINVARKMVTCITNQLMLERPRRIFSQLAKEKLQR